MFYSRLSSVGQKYSSYQIKRNFLITIKSHRPLLYLLPACYIKLRKEIITSIFLSDLVLLVMRIWPQTFFLVWNNSTMYVSTACLQAFALLCTPPAFVDIHTSTNAFNTDNTQSCLFLQMNVLFVCSSWKDIPVSDFSEYPNACQRFDFYYDMNSWILPTTNSFA